MERKEEIFVKLATYVRDQLNRVGVVNNSQVYDLAACLHASGLGDPKLATDMLTLLNGGQSAQTSAQAAVEWAQQQGDAALAQPLEQVKLCAPLPCPGK